MSARQLLRREHLGAFREWLESQRIPFREGWRKHTVLEVYSVNPLSREPGWWAIRTSRGESDFYSLQIQLTPIVKLFLDTLDARPLHADPNANKQRKPKDAPSSSG